MVEELRFEREESVEEYKFEGESRYGIENKFEEEKCTALHEISSGESLFCEICNIYYCPICAATHSHSKFPKESRYRHKEDQKIPKVNGYKKGSIIEVISNPNTIEDELSVDPEMSGEIYIEEAKKLVRERGRIIKRTSFGWLLCEFRDGRLVYFTPYCLKVIKLYGFVHIQHALGDNLIYSNERRGMFVRASQNKGILHCMGEYKICALILMEIYGDKNKITTKLDPNNPGQVIRVRLMGKNGNLREYWDVLLSILHEIAHFHPKIKGYGGENWTWYSMEKVL